jgi:hypothetical protein
MNSMETSHLFETFHSTQRSHINYYPIFTQFADLCLCLMPIGKLQFRSVLSRF